MAEVTVEVPDPEPTENDTTVVIVNNIPEPESETVVEETVPSHCEHTDTIVGLVERVTRLEVEPEPTVVVEAEPEPEPVEPDEEPERTHWWHEPVIG